MKTIITYYANIVDYFELLKLVSSIVEEKRAVEGFFIQKNCDLVAFCRWWWFKKKDFSISGRGVNNEFKMPLSDTNRNA